MSLESDPNRYRSVWADAPRAHRIIAKLGVFAGVDAMVQDMGLNWPTAAAIGAAATVAFGVAVRHGESEPPQL